MTRLNLIVLACFMVFAAGCSLKKPAPTIEHPIISQPTIETTDLEVLPFPVKKAEHQPAQIEQKKPAVAIITLGEAQVEAN